jgi:lipopolysaccharide export system permease protein
MHRRYAMPLTCLIVVWLGVPLGMQVSRRGPMMGIGLALGLVIAFFILSRLTAPIGTAGRIEPWVAAWIPNILFGAVGVGLFFRAR